MEKRHDRKKYSDRRLQFASAEMLYGTGVLSQDVVRADKIRAVLERLYSINVIDGVPIVVEGKMDRQALYQLGINGEVVVLHRKGGFYEFAEKMHTYYESLVLLLDWDEKGEILQSQVGSLLSGLWEEFAPIRESLKNLCQKDISDVQSIPSLMKRLAGTEVVVSQGFYERYSL